MNTTRLRAPRRRIVSFAILSLTSALVLFRSEPVYAAELVRVTNSFEARYTEAVLRQVAKVVEFGFTRTEADRVARELDAAKADQPLSWQFEVTYRGATHALQVRAVRDDLGMVDLDFSTTAALAPALRASVDGYLNSRG